MNNDPPITSNVVESEPSETTTSAAVRVSPEMIRATREGIQQLAREIAELTHQDVPPEHYYAEFLKRVVSALASLGGGVWLDTGNQSLQAVAEIGLTELVPDSTRATHDRLLQQTLGAGTPQMIPPHSQTHDGGSVNDTDCLLILVPLMVDGEAVGVVGVFQRANRGPATERGYVQYLMQMAGLAASYWQNQRLHQLSEQHAWSQQLESFLAEVHRRLGVIDTAYTVVNESRRLTGVDRVALALGTGRRCQLKVVSGLDSIDRRAQQIRQLSQLTARAMKTREAVWLGADGSELPPEIEVHWDRYVDMSHVRRCAIIPLTAPTDDDTKTPAAPFGALIFEQIGDGHADDSRDRRVAQLAGHSASALHNALEHERIFLLPLWRTLGNLLETLGGRHFSKTLLVSIVLMAAAFALVTRQSDFDVPVYGKMQPQVRRTVFAAEDGVITEVLVEHGEMVEAGQVLLQMRNTDLEVEITSLVGQQTTTREQMLSLQRAMLDDPRLDAAQQNRLSGELLRLRQLAASVDQELALVRNKEQQLVVRADRPGQVVTWHVRDKLLHRPVQKGQALMAVVNPDSQWELELFVPERHVGHLLTAASAQPDPLTVTFSLSSHPDQTWEGQLVEIDEVAVPDEEYGSSVRLRAVIDKQQLPELRSDATVVAKVHCGQRVLGYAWFHDLLDTVYARVLFWL